MSREIRIAVDGGHLAALDHGGAGRPLLLVHGSGHNAAAWNDVAARLVPGHRVVAVDLRGHGHSSAESTSAEQYWRDLAAVVEALSWHRPLLVGHSTGGYAVTAATAANLLVPSALCLVDGLVLDDRAAAARALAGFRKPEAVAELARTFGYGLRVDAAGMQAWIDEQVRVADEDWLNSGAAPALVREVATRSFTPDGAGLFVRRPTIAEIAMTTTADVQAPVYPSVDVYERIGCPVTVVLPTGGFYAHRQAEIERIAAAAPQRRLVKIDSNHNPVMTRPAELAAIISAVAADSW